MREEKSNLNLTPHTTVFHQFPIEAMVGPGIRTGIEKIFSLSGSNSFNVFLYSIFQPSVYQAASVEFMPAMRCPSPCPTLPCPPQTLQSVGHAHSIPCHAHLKKQSRPCLCAYLVRCFFFALMLFLKLVLYTQTLNYM